MRQLPTYLDVTARGHGLVTLSEAAQDGDGLVDFSYDALSADGEGDPGRCVACGQGPDACEAEAWDARKPADEAQPGEACPDALTWFLTEVRPTLRPPVPALAASPTESEA